MKNIVSSLLKLAKYIMTPEEEADLVESWKEELEHTIESAFRKDEPFEVDDVKWGWDKGQKGGYTDPSWDPYVDEIHYDIPKKWLIEWKDMVLGSEVHQMDNLERIAIFRKIMTPFHPITIEDVEFDFGDLGTHMCEVTITHAEPTHNGIEVRMDVETDDDKLMEIAQKYDEDRNDY